MLSILSITGPIYLAILTGFISVRAGLFKASDMRLLGSFVLYVALPALLFTALSTKPFGEIIRPGYMTAYLIGSLIMVTLGYTFSRLVRGQGAAGAGMSAMGMSCPNSGFVGYPLGVLIYPDFAGVVLALNMLVENAIIIPFLLALASQQKGGRPVTAFLMAAGRLVRNPLVIALALGLVVSLLPFELPSVLTRTVGLFAGAAAPVSLFVIGGTLAGLAIGGVWKDAVPVIAGKLLMHPLAILAGVSIVAASGLLPLTDLEVKALIITGALPIFGIYTILAQAHGQEELSAVALTGTTVVSFGTLSVLLWYLGF
ncbi:MAG: permease [Phyllobacteriaceae bacterium]|nr:permease [Phyllobacteriaceae bacterium]MBA91839.1 permease [Phyllobacteriaceae bacterium]